MLSRLKILPIPFPFTIFASKNGGTQKSYACMAACFLDAHICNQIKTVRGKEMEVLKLEVSSYSISYFIIQAQYIGEFATLQDRFIKRSLNLNQRYEFGIFHSIEIHHKRINTLFAQIFHNPSISATDAKIFIYKPVWAHFTAAQNAKTA